MERVEEGLDGYHPEEELFRQDSRFSTVHTFPQHDFTTTAIATPADA